MKKGTTCLTLGEGLGVADMGRWYDRGRGNGNGGRKS
jgi:hypothetical protein